MYTPQFDYVRASTVAEAISLLNQHDNARLLAGGHSLLPALKLRLDSPGTLIDIGRIKELKGIRMVGGAARIGALTTHAVVANSLDVPRALAEAAGVVGDPQVRNRGTIGGNVVHADPASDLPTALTALDATFNIEGPGGERSISASDFFIDLFQTAMQSDELLTSIDIPVEAQGSGSAYTKLPDPASKYAVVGAAASITMSDGICTVARAAVGGLTPTTTRTPSVEKALVGTVLDDQVVAAAAKAVENDLVLDIIGDIHAGAEYRKAMAAVFLKRALERAWARSRG